MGREQYAEKQQNLKLKLMYLTLSRKYKLDGNQFVIFKSLSYCFEETIGFGVKASFASRPVSRLIRRYSRPGDITKEF